jgi:hypothetical protein
MAFEPPAGGGGTEGGEAGDTGMITVTVVHIPALLRHVAVGWSEAGAYILHSITSELNLRTSSTHRSR